VIVAGDICDSLTTAEQVLSSAPGLSAVSCHSVALLQAICLRRLLRRLEMSIPHLQCCLLK